MNVDSSPEYCLSQLIIIVNFLLLCSQSSEYISISLNHSDKCAQILSWELKKPGEGEFIPLVSDQTLDRTSGHKPNLKQLENPGWLRRIRKESPEGPATGNVPSFVFPWASFCRGKGPAKEYKALSTWLWPVRTSSKVTQLAARPS